MGGIDLSNLEIYCRNETCGEPLPGLDGVARYNKRRMMFSGKSWMFTDGDVHVYMCPVCGSKRHFKKNLIFSGFHEV